MSRTTLKRGNALPRKFFGAIDSKWGIPRNNIIFTGVLAQAEAFAFTYQFAADVLNFGAFLAFMGVNAAAFRRYFMRGERTASNCLAPLAALAICFYLWLHLRTPARIAGCVARSRRFVRRLEDARLSRARYLVRGSARARRAVRESQKEDDLGPRRNDSAIDLPMDSWAVISAEHNGSGGRRSTSKKVLPALAQVRHGSTLLLNRLLLNRLLLDDFSNTRKRQILTACHDAFARA